MKALDKQELLNMRNKKMAKLMETTCVDNDTQFDVLDEATLHLVNHFEPPQKKQFENDHCLILGQCYFGREATDETVPVAAKSMFMAGDIHALAHTIAQCMREDKEFAWVIAHAVECVAVGK